MVIEYQKTDAVIKIYKWMIKKIYDLPNIQATMDLAEKIASLVKVEDALLLSGPLGIGKTAFARSLIRSVCHSLDMEVPSPSFTLVQYYDGPEFPLYHYDLWRLENEQDLIELDWDDAREGVVLVEWPERLQSLLPEKALHISFSLQSDSMRRAVLSGWDERLRLIE